MWAIFVGCDVVIMPYEYAVYLIIYGFGMMNLKEFIKLNALRSLVMIACFFIVLIPYWYLIGLIWCFKYGYGVKHDFIDADIIAELIKQWTYVIEIVKYFKKMLHFVLFCATVYNVVGKEGG